MARRRRSPPLRIVPLALAAALLATLLLGAVARPAAAASHAEPLEQAVKATYLYKFTPFVEWPPSAHVSPTSPYTLCVLDGPGDGGGVGTLLDRAVAGQKLGDRGFTVRRLARMEPGMRCHMLFIADGDPQASAEALDLVRGQPVLTITDAARDPRTRGIVNFVIREGRVRFEIDNQAASASGLAVSSKLLSLAVSVRGRG